jgi:hypothetical protein
VAQVCCPSVDATVTHVTHTATPHVPVRRGPCGRCTFRNNTGDYGAVVDDGGTSTSLFEESLFVLNRAGHMGGAFYGFGSGRTKFLACRFEANSAPADEGNGNCAYLSSKASPEFVSCEFDGTASPRISDGGCMDARDSSTITIRNSTFTGFRAMQGGAILVSVEATLVLNSSRLIANEAVRGGAVYLKGSSEKLQAIVGTSFVGNSAEAGGALFVDSSVSALVSGCTFQRNRAQASGGAIENSGAPSLQIDSTRFVENSAPGGEGGAISLERGSVSTTIASCQFSRNAASKGGAVSSKLAPVRIAHCDFEANAALKLGDGSEGCTLTGSNGGALLLMPARLVPGLLPFCMLDEVVLHNLTFRANAATDQGGVHSRTRMRAWRCVAVRRLAHRSVALGSIQLDFNKARTVTTCGPERPLASPDVLCRNCSFDANVAGTGPIISSPPKALMWPNESADAGMHDSDVAFSVRVGAIDAFGSAIHGGHDAFKVYLCRRLRNARSVCARERASIRCALPSTPPSLRTEGQTARTCATEWRSSS